MHEKPKLSLFLMLIISFSLKLYSAYINYHKPTSYIQTSRSSILLRHDKEYITSKTPKFQTIVNNPAVSVNSIANDAISQQMGM